MRLWTVVLLVVWLGFSACSPSNLAEETSASPVPDALAQEKQRLDTVTAQEVDKVRQALLARKVGSDPLSDSVWKAFRSAVPYHIQEIGLSKSHPDGSRTIILSEPPPDVALADLLEATGSQLISYEIQRQPIGYGGWAKDLVLRVSGDDHQVAELTSRLSRALFQTSYKTHFLTLPLSRPHRRWDLDLDVRPGEIQQWISNEQETFVPVLGGEAKAGDDVFGESSSAVYFSGRPGLVAWWIPKDAVIDDLRAEARQFALDSDLIVGSIGRPSGVLILGRERAVPVEDLPPLRFETIRLLASVKGQAKAQLAQSYERNAPLAGRIGKGRDWAPIYLSPELVDTEYGSLLNITDQLLKGWSNAGQTRYENFDTYPRPMQFPFGNQPLPAVLDAKKLTYNWNTVGAGYTLAMGDRNVFALYRTGALPVSYFPEGASEGDPRVVAAEKAGYDYFATLNDPNLVRVVQYAALYQVFTAFHVAGSRSPIPTNDYPEQVRRLLVDEVKSEIRGAGEPELSALSASVARTILEQEGLSRENLSLVLIQKGIEPGTALHKKVTTQFAEMLQRRAAEMAPQVAQELKSAADDSEGVRGRSPLRSEALAALAGLRNIPRRYAEAVAAKSAGWIHTPAVVISYNKDSLAVAVGGHNLYSHVTEVEVTDAVAEGAPELGEGGVLRIHPNDTSKARELELVAARHSEEEPSVMTARLREVAAHIADTPPRERFVALKLETRLPSAVRRGGSNGGGGWWVDVGAGGRPPEQPLLMGGAVVERRADRTIHIVVDGRQAEASTMEDATDAVVQMLRKGGGGEHGVNVELRGIRPDEAQGFVATCNRRTNAAERELNTLVEERRIDPDALALLGNRRYDFKRARVLVGEPITVGQNTQATLSVEIPRLGERVIDRTEVQLRFRGDTSPGIVRTILDRIATRVRAIISEMGDAFSMVAFNLRLSHEIKAIHRETGIALEIVKQQFRDAQHDLLFVDRHLEALPNPIHADSRAA
jgi:hypothetical protein